MELDHRKIVAIFFVLLFLCVENASAASLIYKLDFESTDWESAFRSGAWQGKVTRVTSNPHNGSYCLRGNLMEARGNDPITGLPGEGNPQLEFVGNNISSQTPNEIFIRYWRRLDHSTWDGSLSGYGKGEYLTDDEDSVRAYYTGMAWNQNDYVFVGNGAYPQSEDIENWGRLKAYLYGSDPGGADGQWHKFEFYVDYRDPNNKYVKMWVDGQLLEARGSAVGHIIDGKVKVNDSFHLRGLQLLYVANSQVSSSTDGNGYACGYQFDDIEVWDGMPTDNPLNVNITFPTTASTYTTLESSIGIGGNASDDVGISAITWSNNRGGSGIANNGSGDWTSWSIENIALQEGDNVITVTATDSADQTSSDTITVTFGGERGNIPPNVNITSPTSETTYATSQDTIAISGNASDDVGISTITWSNDRGGNGTANNNSGDWTSWSIENIALQEGDNVITVTATDSADQTSSDTITVTSSDIVQAWSATAQTGDSVFKDSVVTYCVRLLIEGDQVAQSGSTVRLGFQGRSSGDYTIRKISVAERDMGSTEGDVIDSTWTRVTFDGNSEATWASDVIAVAAGTEKLSDSISFSLQAGKDYYITFKIDTPSVYLNPPASYRELYFSSADHTDDIDWSGNGHSITQDYHALSKIYVISGETPSVPSEPTGLTVIGE